MVQADCQEMSIEKKIFIREFLQLHGKLHQYDTIRDNLHGKCIRKRLSMFEKTALYLTKTACPSIAFRIRKEIFQEDGESPEMHKLQKRILEVTEVKRVLSLQKEDGWLGGLFHGTDEPESGIRYLMEMGVERSHPAVQKALQAILYRGVDFDRGCLIRVGKHLDAWHLGGSILIKACVFAYAGEENHDFVRNGIVEALNAFRYVCTVLRVEDIFENYKNKKVFRPGALWPCVYHLRLLALTHSWRTEENRQMLAKAVTRLSELSPIPEIKLLYKQQVIAPASAFMYNFNSDMASLSDFEWMMWFHRTEMIARLGIASKVQAIQKQLDYVSGMAKENEGLFTKQVSHFSFMKWSAYSGLALEDGWKTKDRRVNDLTFRWLLIQHYAAQ
jgi:hypothetical protein